MTCEHRNWTCFYEDRDGKVMAYCQRCRASGSWQWWRGPAELALELYPTYGEPKPPGEAEIFTKRTP